MACRSLLQGLYAEREEEPRVILLVVIDQRQALAVGYLGRSVKLSEDEPTIGLMPIAKICDGVDYVDVLKMKTKLRKALETRQSMLMPIKQMVNAIYVVSIWLNFSITKAS